MPPHDECERNEVIATLVAERKFMKDQLSRLQEGQEGIRVVLESIGKTLVSLNHTAESVKRLHDKFDTLTNRVDSLERNPGERALKLIGNIEQWIIRLIITGGLAYLGINNL